MKSIRKLSRQLAFILRHDKKTPLMLGGWLPVTQLIELHGFTRQDIMDIVASDEKKRYEIDEREDKIRARYGHSIDVNLSLSPELPPETLYHGTAARYQEDILSTGIQAKARQYVHLSVSIDDAFEIGARHGTPKVCQIDARRMHQDGLAFYRINNNIWLTKEIPVEYIKTIHGSDISGFYKLVNGWHVPIYTDSLELGHCLCESSLLKDISMHFAETTYPESPSCDDDYGQLKIVVLCDGKYSDADTRTAILADLESISHDVCNVIVVSAFDCYESDVPWVKVSDTQSAYQTIESILMLLKGSYPMPLDYNDFYTAIVCPRKRVYLHAEESDRLGIADIERIISDAANGGNNRLKDAIVQIAHNAKREVAQHIVCNFWKRAEPFIDDGIICCSRMPELKANNVRINLFYRHE